jgi:hypothetical protein
MVVDLGWSTDGALILWTDEHELDIGPVHPGQRAMTMRMTTLLTVWHYDHLKTGNRN